MASLFTTTSFTSSNNSIPDTDIEKSCSEYYQNITTFIIKDYEGIPGNLIINLCAWTVLLIIFTFIRRIGDYGRFGLVKQDDERQENRRFQTCFIERWASKFFANNLYDDTFISTDENNHQTQPNPDQVSVANSETPVSNQNSSTEVNNPNLASERTLTRTLSSSSQDYPHSKHYEDKYLFSWLIHMYTLRDEHIQEKSGKDAINYLVFQRYLILCIFVITILTLIVLLPINILAGTAISDTKLFSRTTISNVTPGSDFLWVHLVLSWAFLVFGFLSMRQFSIKMAYTEGDYNNFDHKLSIRKMQTKLYIKTLPVNLNFKLRFKSFLKLIYIKREAYSDFVITDIQFAYDIRKLSKLFKSRRAMQIGRITSEKIFLKTNQRPTMLPFHFGSFVELCCCCCHRYLKDKKLVDSIDFYTKNENELKIQIEKCREQALKKPLGILFITFEEQAMAAKFLKDYHHGAFTVPIKKLFSEKNRCTSCYLCKSLPRDSSLSKELRSDKWNVKYAASPSNLKWENISKYGFSWWARVILINTVLFILMVFFTTPAILLDKITSWSDFFNIQSIEKIVPEYITEFLPSLVLRLLAAVLPVLVALTALAELHWTRSAENRSMMIKTFLILIFMVLILPTLGLTSIDALFQWFKDNRNVKWRCVSDNGAFFIKYVTTCSLTGTALDLLRIPELLLYLLRMMWSRSSAERQAVRMQAAFEFDYGINYAWVLTVFTVTLCFSVVCPLITPFGLLYLVMKHLVDRYNLFFAYTPTKVDKRIHKTAVSFCVASFIMLQFCILFFIAIRNKGNVVTNSMSSVQTAVIIISCIIFLGRIFFGFFKNFSPFNGSINDCINDSSNLQNNYNEFNNTNNHNSISSNLNKLKTTNINQKRNQSISKSESASSLDPISTNFKPNVSKSSINQIQSPFLPSVLRTSTRDLQLEVVANIPASSTEINAKQNVELKPIQENDIEILVENNSKSSNSKSKSISILHGALNKATNILKSNKDGGILQKSEIKEDEVGIANRGFEDEN